MPVRSLDSSVLRWPERADIERGLARWATEQFERRRELLRLGCFGSFARGADALGRIST
jgi:hypothetical protein